MKMSMDVLQRFTLYAIGYAAAYLMCNYGEHWIVLGALAFFIISCAFDWIIAGNKRREEEDGKK